MSCAPLSRLLGPKAIATIKQGTGSLPPAVAFQVWGFDPRLRVVVEIYFSPANPALMPVGPDVYTVTPVVKDGSGRVLPLQAIMTSQALPDGHEWQTGAQGINFSCQFSFPSAAPASPALGTWYAQVRAMPAVCCPDPIAQDLLSALHLSVPTTVLSFFDSST